MNKLIILIIVVAVIAAGIGAYFVFQKPAIPETPITTLPSYQDSHFGINDAFLGGLDIKSISEGEKFLKERCAIMNDLGARWARGPSLFSAMWMGVEREKGQFDYSWADLGVQVSQKCGVQWLQIITPYPQWEQTAGDPSENRPPIPVPYSDADESEFVKYVKKTVERYDGDGVNDMSGLKNPVKYWELGNEPMLPISGLMDNPQRFTNFLKVGYETIKRTYPDSIILIGGSADDSATSMDYLEKVMNMNGGRYFDIMNFHAYELRESAIERQTLAYSQMLKEHGYNKSFWITEIGDFSEGVIEPMPGINGSVVRQARWVTKSFVLSFINGVEKVFWTSLIDSDFLNAPITFGLITKDGKRKPSYYTYKLTASKLDYFESAKKINEGVYKFEFTDKDPVYVLWSDSGNKTIDLSKDIQSENVQLTHIIEEENQTEPKKEIVKANSIPITESPVFIEEQ